VEKNNTIEYIMSKALPVKENRDPFPILGGLNECGRKSIIFLLSSIRRESIILLKEKIGDLSPVVQEVRSFL